MLRGLEARAGGTKGMLGWLWQVMVSYVSAAQCLGRTSVARPLVCLSVPVGDPIKGTIKGVENIRFFFW